MLKETGGNRQWSMLIQRTQVFTCFTFITNRCLVFLIFLLEEELA